MAVHTLESPHMEHSDAHPHHPPPRERLIGLLIEDRRDITILLVYTAITGVLSLVLPLAAQAVVNTIAAGILIQPLYVLTSLVFAGLLMAGILRLLQLQLIETMQQRIFARVSLRVASILPRIKQSALDNAYAPELVNRFFDVITIQKSLSKLLLDGPASMLQVLVGLLLLAFYHPFLLAFDLLMIGFILFAFFVLGAGGLQSSIAESVQKYRVAEWLEELGRCQRSFKLNGVVQFFVQRADEIVISYIQARRKHFRVLFRQAMGNHLFYAIASAGVLGIGGFLVIDRQLTLGQLVASELVVVSVLSALDKLIRLMEDHFDLLTGLDKVGHVTDLPVERVGGTAITEHAPAIGVEFRKVHFSYRPNQPIIQDLSLNIQPGERVALVGNSGAGKSTCANLICGLLEPTHGSVEVDQLDVRDIDLSSLRHLVDLCADANEIFDGTVEENIVVGREWLNHNDVNWALEMTQLSNDLLQLPLGRKTRLVSEGQNISRGQRQLILLARTIVGRPKFLILDDAFTGIPENKKMNILDAIYDPANSWTILSISHDGEVVSRSDRVYVLDRGHLIEYGTPRELAMNRDGHFSQLFPELTSRLSQSTKRQKG